MVGTANKNMNSINYLNIKLWFGGFQKLLENTADLNDHDIIYYTSVEEKSFPLQNSEQEVKASLWTGGLLECFVYSVF